MTSTFDHLRELASTLDGDAVIPVRVETLMNGAAEIELYRETLERVERVLAFNLRSKIAWGDDYNQAVKDIYDATRKVLGKTFVHADDLTQKE
jgi:hypothetical protein